jgi:hypothetical protein
LNALAEISYLIFSSFNQAVFKKKIRFEFYLLSKLNIQKNVRIKLHPLLAKTKTKFFLNFISSKIAAWKAKAALGRRHK